jgi:hypothetical protein
MKIVRRILITVFLSVTLGFILIYYVSPIALSFYGSSKAIPITRVVPTDLKDSSIASASGTKLSYLGYEFEVPWNDLDGSQTVLIPKDKPDKNRVILNFRSGLRLMATKCPPREMADEMMRQDVKMTSAAFAAVFGPKAVDSDYEFMKRVFEFSPDKMHHWALRPPVHAREEVLLVIKTIVPSRPAKSGIFNIHNASYEGYQQGDPSSASAKDDGIILSLYSQTDTFELIVAEGKSTHLVTQPEINRIVQSLHKVELNSPVAQR